MGEWARTGGSREEQGTVVDTVTVGRGTMAVEGSTVDLSRRDDGISQIMAHIVHCSGLL